MNHVYDGDNAWADYNEAGEAIARYLFGDGIDSNIARWRAGQGTAWYLADHLGTVRAITDAVGMLVNQTTYDSFGQVLTETNSLLGDRFKFTGRELNSGSDYYYRARQYNASSGRFGSLDQIGFSAGDANLYRFVNNSPTFATDPTGNTTVVETTTFGQREVTTLEPRRLTGCQAAIAFVALSVPLLTARLPPGALQFVAPPTIEIVCTRSGVPRTPPPRPRFG